MVAGVVVCVALEMLNVIRASSSRTFELGSMKLDRIIWARSA